METLIFKGENDLCRVYQTKSGFELRFNLISEGDPTYLYQTAKGAKIAAKKMTARGGKYENCRPSTKWE